MAEKLESGVAPPIWWRRHLPDIISWGVLLAICAVALFLRTYFAEPTVIRDGVTYFKENDPWYHVRLVENLMRHFPNRISFDPYTYFPNGQNVFFAPLFDLLLGFAIWVISLGHPTLEIIQRVSLYFPAVAGTLVAVPVYFIGKELFHRWAGLIAAGILVITPNAFLARSLMGFSDHHVIEVLISTTMFLFLILSFKQAAAGTLTFDAIKKRDRASLMRPLVYIFLFGVFLGTYILAWSGGLLMVFTIFVAFILIYLISYLSEKPVDFLVITGVPAFAIALAVIMPFYRQLFQVNLGIIALAVCLVSTPGLYLVSWIFDKKRISRGWYPLALLALALVSAAGFYLVSPGTFINAASRFKLFTAEVNDLTISEARPFLYARGYFSLTPVWDEFRSGVFFAPIALVMVIWNAARKVSPALWLFVVWCALMVAATLGQIRFTYYLTVNVSLLSGYFLWRLGEYIQKVSERVFLKQYRVQAEALASQERRRTRLAKARKSSLPAEEHPIFPAPQKPRWPASVSFGVIGFIILSLVVFPDYRSALAMASSTTGPSEDWYESLVWLKENTPEPFGDPDFFYNYYERPEAGTGYAYPDSAYGVMSWWDYGHWITEIGHRIPNANPHQMGAKDAALFFVAQDEETGSQILDRVGSRYVIIDKEMAIPYRISADRVQLRKFYSIAVWSGENPDSFFDDYYELNNETWEAVPLYYPEYYQSMCARLFCFNGEAKNPQNSTVVISYAVRSGRKEILSEQTFPNYDAAQVFLSKQNGSNWRIVGKNPFVSPVPLKKLQHYQPVYGSATPAIKAGDKVLASVVEIFSYKP